DRLGVALVAEDRQAEPPDRSGDVAAVDDKLVEGLVAGAADVELDAVDEVGERIDREVEAVAGVGEADQNRVAVAVEAGAGEQRQGLALARERGELFGLRE